MISMTTLLLLFALDIAVIAPHCLQTIDASFSLSSQITFRVQSPWLLVDAIYYRTSYGKKYKRMTEVVHSFTTRVIKKRRKELAGTIDQDNDDDHTEEGIYHKKRLQTFLDILLRHSLDNDTSFSDEDIREEVDTFMFEERPEVEKPAAICPHELSELFEQVIEVKLQPINSKKCSNYETSRRNTGAD